MNSPLQYDRTMLSVICPATHEPVALKVVADEDARKWAREVWDRGHIGYDWHPAYIAACRELLFEVRP